MPEPLIILKDVAVGYSGRAVLSNVSLSLARGDSVGLLGANGSGKTTLLKTIAGVLPPVSGRVRFGQDKRPVIGYVPQRESLDQAFMLSCLEVVLMGACGRVGPGKFLGRSEREFARECLDRTGLQDLKNRRFAELSGGQKQRVLIARALMARPDTLLLDEPTAGVDPAATEAIADLLQRLNQDGITLVMVNHDLPVVQRVARRVLKAHNGAVTERPLSEMVRATELQPMD
jgi:ABC-type Mn2+/Zn2+ transport system ATPase subunit